MEDRYDLQDAANLAVDILSIRQAVTRSTGLGWFDRALKQFPF